MDKEKARQFFEDVRKLHSPDVPSSAPTAHEELNAIEATLRSIQSFPLDARRRVLNFAWSWANNGSNQRARTEK